MRKILKERKIDYSEFKIDEYIYLNKWIKNNNTYTLNKDDIIISIKQEHGLTKKCKITKKLESNIFYTKNNDLFTKIYISIDGDLKSDNNDTRKDNIENLKIYI